MPELLNDVEARILGALVEKSITTPEQYPLSFNALLNACNQKTSRDPVMTLDTNTAGKGVASLTERDLVERCLGNRVPKFRHHVAKLVGEDPRTIAVICVLLLRGPQTPGEIKGRTERMCQFAGTAEVEAHLSDLSMRADGPLVERLPRRPGQKEVRYRHLFFEQLPEDGPQAAMAAAPAADDRVTNLETRVAALEELVKTLEARLP